VSKEITIKPVTRIEGHAKVTLQLDDAGEVTEARFHVMELRGFEKFMEGRMFWEAPLITPRICGICSVSHHLAAAKACDDLLGVDIPPAAKLQRELLHEGEIIGDHALHLYFLAAPDLLLGPDAPPEQRNVVGLIAADPDLAGRGVALRKIAQNLVEVVGGRSTHPVTAIPGGMSKPLSHNERHELLAQVHVAVDHARVTLDVIRAAGEKHADLFAKMDGVVTPFVALTDNGNFAFYDGTVKVIDSEGAALAEFAPAAYADYIGEHAEDWSYMKFPYFKALGYPDGIYRVGPLARLNVNSRMGTPLADAALKEFKAQADGPVQGTMQYHHARAINLLYACERTVELLEDPAICDENARTPAKRRAGEGIGIVEAPRGLLIHHYAADDMGHLTKVNLIVATCHNNAAINKSVATAARAFIHDGEPREGLLNRVEMAIRAYDPCLSCGTHAMTRGPALTLEVRDAAGTLMQTVRRDERGRQDCI